MREPNLKDLARTKHLTDGLLVTTKAYLRVFSDFAESDVVNNNVLAL